MSSYNHVDDVVQQLGSVQGMTSLKTFCTMKNCKLIECANGICLLTWDVSSWLAWRNICSSGLGGLIPDLLGAGFGILRGKKGPQVTKEGKIAKTNQREVTQERFEKTLENNTLTYDWLHDWEHS